MRVLDGIQSALNPQGVHADLIAEIAWVLILGAGTAFAGIVAFSVYAIFGARHRVRSLRSERVIIGGGLILPGVILAALLLYTLARTASLAARDTEDRLHIAVTGYQWWWRVAYLTPSGTVDVVTANELRLPARRHVVVSLESADVIHSFWAPTLGGKMDMIPGRTNRIQVRAHRPGHWRGQCAEYCGGPHGLMAFPIVVEEPEHFDAWLGKQREPAAPPVSDSAVKGERLFAEYCAACHTVRGTTAQGALAPDLTHVASRPTLAAGVLQNNPGTLGAWIASSQHIKPGNLMPSFTSFDGTSLRALVDYVSGLE